MCRVDATELSNVIDNARNIRTPTTQSPSHVAFKRRGFSALYINYAASRLESLFRAKIRIFSFVKKEI